MAFVNSRGSILLIMLTIFLFCVSGEGPGGRKSVNGYSSRHVQYDMLLSVANDSEDTTSAGRRLLMPAWAYKSAAGYLLIVSVMGLTLNIIVVLVLLSDQQVIQFDCLF